MEYITQWVKNIIIIVLITTFLGMFLPESNLRKYLRVVMGFFIISIFISPISLVLNGEFAINNSIIPENKMELKWKEIAEDGKNVASRNEQIIDDYYIEKINNRIRTMIGLDFPESKIAISTEIKNKYSIKRINIDIYDRNGIEPVKIEVEGRDKKNQGREINSEDRTKIISCRNLISEFLQISPSIISINYYSGGELIASF